jgi:methionine-rich copper-binding protein CopC
MDIRARLPLIACALLFGISLASCGGDDGPATPTDDTPPAIAAITPLDAYHLEVRFTEPVGRTSAQNQFNYLLTEIAPTPVAPGPNAAPGDEIYAGGAALASDKKTVTLTTQSSMNGLPFDLTVHGVSDLAGNEIAGIDTTKSFTSSGTPDNTAPSIVSYTPAASATDVDVHAPVVLTFSEAVGKTVLWTSSGGEVSAHYETDGLTLTLTPNGRLGYSTAYSVNVTFTDYAGNAGSPLQFAFTTEANPDHTVPTVVSSSPHNLASNVGVNAQISLTFSEPMAQNALNTIITPQMNLASTTWSNGGKTATLAYNAPFAADTQYTLSIPGGGAWDLYDNTIAELYTLTFTTAAQVGIGSIAGMEWGDAGSAADNATGATVMTVPFGNFYGMHYVSGSAKVDANGQFNVQHLADGTYYVISLIDTNHDGLLDPSYGDAVGGFGVTEADLDPDAIDITAGAHITGKDFIMHDPSVVYGITSYSGDQSGGPHVWAGLFAVAGFDGWNSSLLVSTMTFPGSTWDFNTLATYIDEGDYYVGAYYDVNDDNMFEASEPSGFYGGRVSPTVLHMTNGTDYPDINILMTDPTDALVASPPVPMKPAKRDPGFERLMKIVRQGQSQTTSR